MNHVGRAVPNVPLLGAFAALCGLISLEAVQSAIDQRFKGPVALGNKAACDGGLQHGHGSRKTGRGDISCLNKAEARMP